MILKCIGSGSSGNCYLLENDTECLVIEAGVPFKEIKKALNFNISKIVGVICTHSHADHSGRAYEYEAVGIPVLKPYEQTTRLAYLGGFEITAFDLTDRQGRFMHSNSDGSECPCYGFYIIQRKIQGIFRFFRESAFKPLGKLVGAHKRRHAPGEILGHFSQGRYVLFSLLYLLPVA